MKTTLPARLWRLPAALQSQGAVLRLLYVLIYCSGVSWSPFLSVYLRQVGLSGLQIGTLSGIGPAVMLVSQPLWGLVADLRGRRRTLLLTMLASALLLPGFAWPGGFWFLLGWSILHGSLSNPVSPLIDSLVLDHLERQGNGSFGHIRLWGAVGWAVGALVVGRAIAGRDIRLMFAFGAAFMLLGWALVWRGTVGLRGTGSLGKRWRGAGDLLRSRKLVTFLALIVLMQLGTAAVWTFFPVYMTELGAPREMLGYAISIRGLSELPLYLAAAAIIRRYGSGKVFILTVLVFGVRVLLYSAIKVPALAMAVEATHGLSFSLFLVSAVDYIHRLVPREWRATGQALFTAAFFGAGGILGNALSGLLYDRLGAQGMFRVNGWLILGVAVVALVGLREGASGGRDGTRATRLRWRRYGPLRSGPGHL